MANFEAQVRVTYRDVAGLVLSCTRDDVIEDANNPGFVREWINRAPGLPSQPAIRNPGAAAPTFLGGRFSNPKQTVQALQPALAFTGGGERRVQFDRARSSFLQTEFLSNDLPSADTRLAVGYQLTLGGDASNDQVIMADSDDEIVVSRRNGAGDAEIAIDGNLTTVAGDHPAGTFLFTGIRGGTSLWEKDGAAFGTGVSVDTSIFSGAQVFLGRQQAGNYLDATLDSFHLWMGELSPLTQDLIWQTLNEDGTNFATELRGPMNNVVWTDLTGVPALDQYDRLRPPTGFPHRYIRVDLPNAPATHRVQLAAAVDGQVLDDTDLGGTDLFSFAFAEFPGPPFITPLISQDAGWSAVADLHLNQEGHYTVVVTRLNGGGVVLHLDVQVAP